jgi:dolichyl-phosphate-mannose-protein mannosyltransferase
MPQIAARPLRPLAWSLERLRLPQGMLIVVLLASLTYLVDIGEPAAPFWDENYYLTAIQRYEDGIAQFASHPPLGLMLMTAGEVLLHPNRGIDTRKVGWDKKIRGEDLPKGYSFTGVRLASSVFAVLGALAFFGVMYVLTQSVLAAVVFSNLYVFENAFAAHFRAAHLDAFQLAFALCTILCFCVGVRRAERSRLDGSSSSTPGLDFLLGLTLGLATLVKANAIVLGALGALLVLARVGVEWPRRAHLRVIGAAVGDALLMSAGFALAVVAVFTLHVAISPHAPIEDSPAGDKDWGFITPVYEQYLDGERALSPAVVWDATLDYVRFMHSDFTGIPRNDPNGSRPLQWPLDQRAINYRWDSDGHLTGYMQLIGNPVSWLLALIALIATPCLLLADAVRPVTSADPARRPLMLMLLAQYLIFMAVHYDLGLQRVMYLYHYFIGLALAYCLVPLVLAEASERWPVLAVRRYAIWSTLTVLIVVGYAFYFPLSYHVPIPHAYCVRLNTLQHVVSCQ